MQQYTVFIVFGVLAVLLSSSFTTASASVISCPPSDLQEASPNLRQLCYAIEQVISESIPKDQFGRQLDERSLNTPSPKRQDVDHVFLRFGRRFGL